MKILKNFLQHRSGLVLLGFLFVAAFLTLPTDLVAFAQDNASQAAQQAIANQSSIIAQVDTVVQNLASLFSALVKVLNYILWPILFMIGGLMDNSLIFGPGVEDRLYLIWSQIRNLINLLFAVALIGVAIYNVLGLNRDGNYALKTFLPSMVVTLVLVNFSFFGVRLALDIANVATTAVFALPNAVEQGFSEDRINTIGESICNNSSIADLTSNTTDGSGAAITGLTTGLCNGTTLSDSGLAQFQSLDQNNVGLVMAISFNRVAEILEPSQLTISNPSFINLAVNLAIVLILQIVYISAFFALFAVLVARIIALWIITIASPLLVLKLGMSKAQLPGMDFLNSFDLESMFIKHATAPIKIGLAMSVGYMMLDVFQTVGSPSVYFPLGDDFTNVFSGVGTINDLFISIAAIAIVWKVSFDAADGTFADSITNKYRGWAEGIGRSVRNLVVQKAPILPLPNNKGEGPKAITLGSLANAPQEFLQGAGSKLDKITGLTTKQSNPFVKEDHPGMILSSPDYRSKISAMDRQQLELIGKGIAASNSPEFRSQFRSVKKEALLNTLQQVKNKSAIKSSLTSELDNAIAEIQKSDTTQEQSLALARDLMAKANGKTASTYVKSDYDDALKQYKANLKKDE